MPTYEYACKQCGEHLEVVQSFTDDALTECPNCSGQLRKVFGSIGVTFKGSGFYKTDSRSSSSASSGTSAKSETKTADTTSTPETKPAETKPAETKSSDKAAS